MPYVTQSRREELAPLLKAMEDQLRIDGDLNYLLFSLAKHRCHSYNEFKNFRGELRETYLEIYRRLVDHEKQKIVENGDIE